MRAALLGVWPALSECYGIRPVDLPLYSMAEINKYVEELPAALARKQQISMKMG